eukprot:4642023-Ditylum_brightwellii.AAC.1
MDTGKDDIIGTTQELDNKEETNKQIASPSATNSSLQKSLVKIGGDYSVTFGVEANKKTNTNALGATFSSLDEDNEIKEQYKLIGEQLQEKGAEPIDAMI